MKNPSTENLRRGVFRFTGLPLVTLAVAASVTACNVRQLRNWHDRTGNGNTTHPLLAPEPVRLLVLPITPPAGAQALPEAA